FTVLPVAGPAHVDRVSAARALRLLPVVGLLLGGVAAAVGYVVATVVDGTPGRSRGAVLAVASLAAVTGGRHLDGLADHAGTPGRPLGAVLAVASLAALPGGLHLDGLADTADGLGSRRPAPDALAVMRRSDIGPMGVVTLVLVLLLQVVALTVPRPGTAAAGLLTAVVVARVAVVLATAAPRARDEGFGALVAGAAGPLVRYGHVVAVLVLAASPAAFGHLAFGVRLCVASCVGLLVAHTLLRRATRRLGGTTGDVYGAVIETATTAVLLTVALTG